MKTTITLILLAIFAMGCGSKDTPPGVTTQTITNINGNIGVGNTGQTYQDINAVQAAFNAMSLSTGLSEGTYIYHIGPYFGGSTSSGNFQFTVSGCFFGIWGDCGGGSINSQLEDMLDLGEILKVDSLVSASQVNMLNAVGVQNNDFIYESFVYDRNDSTYVDMLSINNTPMQTIISPATIHLSNNTSVQAFVVEYIYGVFGTVSSIERFVLSTNLPVIANPIAVVEGSSSLNLTGVLKSIGNNVQVVRVDIQNLTVLSYGQLYQTGPQYIYLN